jgi:hypothetical protein
MKALRSNTSTEKKKSKEKKILTFQSLPVKSFKEPFLPYRVILVYEGTYIE